MTFEMYLEIFVNNQFLSPGQQEFIERGYNYFK